MKKVSYTKYSTVWEIMNREDILSMYGSYNAAIMDIIGMPKGETSTAITVAKRLFTEAGEVNPVYQGIDGEVLAALFRSSVEQVAYPSVCAELRTMNQKQGKAYIKQVASGNTDRYAARPVGYAGIFCKEDMNGWWSGAVRGSINADYDDSMGSHIREALAGTVAMVCVESTERMVISYAKAGKMQVITLYRGEEAANIWRSEADITGLEMGI